MNKNIEVLVSSTEKMVFSSKRWGIRSKITNEIIELTGFVLGLWEDMNLSFFKSVNGKSEEIVVNFADVKFLNWEVFKFGELASV